MPLSGSIEPMVIAISGRVNAATDSCGFRSKTKPSPRLVRKRREALCATIAVTLTARTLSVAVSMILPISRHAHATKTGWGQRAASRVPEETVESFAQRGMHPTTPSIAPTSTSA